jgi:D-cysteine desulfhydrase
MVGAELRFVTPDDYRDRERMMGDFAHVLIAQGERPYVIPEGGSNGLGAFGYLSAMGEVKGQLNQGQGGGPRLFDAVVHACGSGGTAAGCVLGARAFDVATEVHAMVVGGDAAHFQNLIPRIVADAIALGADDGPQASLLVHDEWIGPGYGEMSEEQHRFLLAVAGCSGLILDPVYTGKALFGLARLPRKPARVLFLHTGGLPGLLSQPAWKAIQGDGISGDHAT